MSTHDGPAASAPEPSEQQQRITSLLRSLSRIPSGADRSSSEAAVPSAAPGSRPSSPGSRDARSLRRQQRRDVQSRHAAMLDGLIRSLDVVVYAQISILYYLDNSLARLLLRAIPHWLFFTPKPAAFPPPPRHRPYVLHITLANLTCALLHLLLAAPAASEAARGYLHGGLLIDFVGERGPVSKPRLLAADLAVLVIQVVLLAVVREREKLRDGMAASAGGTEQSGAAEVGADPAENPAQDHDAEELGIRRDWVEDASWLAEEDPLTAEPGEGDPVEGTARKEQHPLDRFYTGQFVLADLCIWDALRASWKESSES